MSASESARGSRCGCGRPVSMLRRGVRFGIRAATVGVTAGLLAASARPVAAWPLPDPDAPPERLAETDAWPSDPDYGATETTECRGQFGLYSFTPACAAGLAEPERSFGTGIAVDGAWLLTTGTSAVRLAILHEGVDLRDPELGRSIWLNRGEVPAPQIDGTTPGDPFDPNQDGRFDLLDYTSATATETPTVDTVVDRRLVARPDGGDVNGNGRLDPEDLILALSDGVDDDGNGLVDDFVGWDFVDEDAIPSPEDGDEDGGTALARAAAAGTDNALGGAGVCPECRIIVVRVGSGGAALPADAGSGLLYAAGASAASAVVGIDVATPVTWLGDINERMLILHFAGRSTRSAVLDMGGEVWIVGGHTFDGGEPATASTFRAPDSGVRSLPEVDVRAPSRADARSAGILLGAVGLVASAARGVPGVGIEPRALTPAQIQALLIGTMRTPAATATPFPTLDVRAAVDALRTPTAIPGGAWLAPARGRTLDPDRAVDVKFRVTAPPGSRVAWTLRAMLGAQGRPPRERSLASGTVEAATSTEVGWSGSARTWFRDAVSAPRRPEDLAVDFEIVLETSELRIPYRRRAYVHRDLASWPGYPVDLGFGVEAGVRRGLERLVVVAGDGGFIARYSAPDSFEATVTPGGDDDDALLRVDPTDVSGGADRPSPRLAARGVYGRGPEGVPPAALRTPPTAGPNGGLYALTSDGSLLAWFDDQTRFVDDVTPFEPRPPRSLIRGTTDELWAITSGMLLELAASPTDVGGIGRRIPVASGLAPGARDPSALWLASGSVVERIRLSDAAVTSFEVGPGAGPGAPVTAGVRFDDREGVAAAWPDAPWAVVDANGSRLASRLPIAWTSDLIAADFDGDDEIDLAGYVRDPQLGTAVMVYSLQESSPIEGFPVPLARRPTSPPIAADMDGDQRPDLIFMSDPRTLQALGRAGTAAPGFPKLLGEPALGPPLVTDIDGDGSNELFVATRSGRLFGFRTSGRSGALFSWPQVRHDVGAQADAQVVDPRGSRDGGGGCRSQRIPASRAGPAIGVITAIGILCVRRRRLRCSPGSP